MSSPSYLYLINRSPSGQVVGNVPRSKGRRRYERYYRASSGCVNVGGRWGVTSGRPARVASRVAGAVYGFTSRQRFSASILTARAFLLLRRDF